MRRTPLRSTILIAEAKQFPVQFTVHRLEVLESRWYLVSATLGNANCAFVGAAAATHTTHSSGGNPVPEYIWKEPRSRKRAAVT